MCSVERTKVTLEELVVAATQPSQAKEVISTSSYYSPYISQHVQLQDPKPQQHLASNASSNPILSGWLPPTSFISGPPPHEHIPVSHPKFPLQDMQQHDRRKTSEAHTINIMVLETKYIYQNLRGWVSEVSFHQKRVLYIFRSIIFL